MKYEGIYDPTTLVWFPLSSHLVRGQELVGHLTASLPRVQRIHVRHRKEEATRCRRTVRQLLNCGLGYGRAQRDRWPHDAGKAHPREQRGRNEQRTVGTETGTFRPIVCGCLCECECECKRLILDTFCLYTLFSYRHTVRCLKVQ